MSRRSRLGLALLLCVLGPVHAADDFAEENAKWRADRVARLTAPEGWLTLIGLHWLQPGTNTIGSAPDNSIQFAGGPPHLGVVELEPSGIVRYTPTEESNATTNDLLIRSTKTGRVVLEYRDGARPSVVRAGSLSFFAIQRGERVGLRVRDSEAERRRSFAGIDYFPADPSWRIEADWVPFETPREIPITNMLGQTTPTRTRGKAVFTRDGQTIELLPIDNDDGSLFFIISDATSGVETYEASRFLYAAPPRDGKVILDFNRAQNPPCAFTPFATCPLPPKENRLKIRLDAGEKNYRGPHD